ncbi:MAG: TetR/AcrR family transcriptional regulator [Deltaproteobacteria bacterium]|nr:TetR/AcrR family transcriptional regulator [Deltaproteobacteria bacterium]
MGKSELEQSPEASDKSKRLLLEAAKKLFAEKGLDGTTVRELADEAGVNLSLVSYYFDGKEGLFRTVLSEFGQKRLEATQRLFKSPETFDEVRVRLEMFVEEIFNFHIEEPYLPKIVHRECENAFTIAPDIFKQTFLKVFETLLEFLKQAQANGFLRADLDPFISAQLFFGSLMHLIRNDPTTKKYFDKSISDKNYRTLVTQQLLQNFFEGCKK